MVPSVLDWEHHCASYCLCGWSDVVCVPAVGVSSGGQHGFWVHATCSADEEGHLGE
jgi:hypothetical protein